MNAQIYARCRMSKEEIFLDICSKLREIKNGDKIDFSHSTPLLGEGGVIGSLSVITLVDWCFDKYKVDLIDDDLSLNYLETIGDLTEYIYNQSK